MRAGAAHRCRNRGLAERRRRSPTVPDRARPLLITRTAIRAAPGLAVSPAMTEVQVHVVRSIRPIGRDAIATLPVHLRLEATM